MSDKAQGTAVPKRRGRQFSADERKQILDRAKELDNVVAVAKEWGVAPSTVYSWRERYEEKGIEGLVDKSSRPHHQPKKTTQWIIVRTLRASVGCGMILGGATRRRAIPRADLLGQSLDQQVTARLATP